MKAEHAFFTKTSQKNKIYLDDPLNDFLKFKCM